MDVIHDEAQKTPHLVILGNPGIGKTFFGYVMLLYFARMGATVVYQAGNNKKQWLLFSRDVVLQGSNRDFGDILKLPTTYYIVDDMPPACYASKTILVTSPHRSIWYEFAKTRCTFRYMPVWSEQEIMNCHSLMYSGVPVANVRDCFRR